MSIDITNLTESPRLLIEADLRPIQGATFQPAGFPDLGAAVYKGYDEYGNQADVLLVESQQSMANRLERVCWDDANDDLVPVLAGLPYVRADLWRSGKFTSSILEAHRLASPYITGKSAKMKDDSGGEKPFGDFFKEEADLSDPIDVRSLAKALFKYDPSSVLHGVFMAQIRGTARLRRCVSAFVEATDVEAAVSGGVKNDRVFPSHRGGEDAIKAAGRGKRLEGRISDAEGFGNVPYSRTNIYSAKTITAYFNLDLSQIRAYGLGESAERLLTVLALWKIRKVLETGLRFRTDCDLIQVGELKVGSGGVSEIPETAALESELPKLLRACDTEGLFAQPPVTKVTFA